MANVPLRRWFALTALALGSWLLAAGCGDTLIEPLVVSSSGSGSGADCAPPTTACDGSCYDLSMSNEHCGSCGVECSSGAFCNAGSCVCQEGQTRCDDVCTSLETDPQNCGACGYKCDSGHACFDGDCMHDCESPPAVECGGVCVDLDKDPEHCGDCDNKCDSGKTCNGGQCS